MILELDIKESVSPVISPLQRGQDHPLSEHDQLRMKPVSSFCPWLPQDGWIDNCPNNMSCETSSLKIRITQVMLFSYVVL